MVEETMKTNENDDVSARGTRTSARIQKLKSTKEAVRRREQEEAVTKVEKPLKKQRRQYNKRKGETSNVLTELVRDEDVCNGVVDLNGSMVNNEGGICDEKKEMTVFSPPKGQNGEKSSYSMVTDTVRAFYKHFLHFVQVFKLLKAVYLYDNWKNSSYVLVGNEVNVTLCIRFFLFAALGIVYYCCRTEKNLGAVR